MLKNNYSSKKITKVLLCMMFLSLAISDFYKEPNYTLISQENNIQIRQYSECVIAKTSIKNGDSDMNNSMFRILASYIFQGNDKNQSIPMTTPVLTRYDNESYDMIFFMLDANKIDDLPNPISKDVSLETINLNKVVAIEFAWWTTKNNIRKNRKIIEQYIKDNNLEVISDMMVAQYNPPMSWPLSRRNELIFQIK